MKFLTGLFVSAILVEAISADFNETTFELEVKPEVWEGKRYEMYESHFFDEYMYELGVGFFTVLIINAVTPTTFIEKNGNKYKLTTESNFKTSVIEFELGKEFDDETLDDRNVKSVVTLEGNKFIHRQGGAKPTTITGEFTPTELVVVMTIGDVVCTQKYRAV